MKQNMTPLKIVSLKEMIYKWNNLQKIPIGISILDENLGGIIKGHLHVVCGEPGVGKTWFCLRIIKYMLNLNIEASILYIDFNSHLRFSNILKVCNSSQNLEKIDFFRPKNLFEQIIFFKSLLDKNDSSYDLVILDTVFGSPLESLKVLKYEKKIWKNRIIDHLSDLRELAYKREIPIIIVDHLTTQDKSSFSTKPETQPEQYLLEQFIPIIFLISKKDNKHFLQFNFCYHIVGETEFGIIP